MKTQKLILVALLASLAGFLAAGCADSDKTPPSDEDSTDQCEWTWMSLNVRCQEEAGMDVCYCRRQPTRDGCWILGDVRFKSRHVINDSRTEWKISVEDVILRGDGASEPWPTVAISPTAELEDWTDTLLNAETSFPVLLSQSCGADETFFTKAIVVAPPENYGCGIIVGDNLDALIAAIQSNWDDPTEGPISSSEEYAARMEACMAKAREAGARTLSPECGTHTEYVCLSEDDLASL
ncbi:MAG: hypothetical protein C4523_06380 [Myxococcales bacterium]|nr:MAG: hypothetical protein C4523_06380 [Myxococcales bacterium]